ncbi:hypothetical protein [Reyranella sp.]|uniref:hypothetical protein n=1 Tax=Reyranella sp. TaxID=1929291 RepID=UPI003BAD6C17
MGEQRLGAQDVAPDRECRLAGPVRFVVAFQSRDAVGQRSEAQRLAALGRLQGSLVDPQADRDAPVGGADVEPDAERRAAVEIGMGDLGRREDVLQRYRSVEPRRALVAAGPGIIQPGPGTRRRWQQEGGAAREEEAAGDGIVLSPPPAQCRASA